MLKNLTGLFIVLFGSTAMLFAQEGTLSGNVKDQATGETLIGAAVVYAPGKGAATDIDGKYSLKLPYGDYVIEVSYVGYKKISQSVTINSGFRNLDFSLQSEMLREVEVVADLAISRETPVAFSNVTPLQIKEELGSSDLPLLLNTTPGIYVSPTGGDDGGARVAIRGFQDRNVTVMIDGIPINNMDNGNVFWASTFGIDGVLANMQVQRGMTSSRLAIPAIGGTINFITKSIENKPSLSVKQDFGSFNTLRTSLGYNSGRLKNGWGYSVAGSYRGTDGYSEQQYRKEYFYYAKVQKEIGKHIISISAMGSPVEYGLRRTKQKIATYSRDLALDQFKGSDELYAELARYNVASTLMRFNNNPNSAIYQEQLAIKMGIAQQNGWGYYDGENFVIDESYYKAISSQNDFIDTTGVITKGTRYNNHWGYLHGKRKNEAIRQYNKPIFSVRDFWAISDKLYLSNVVYYSYGKGGSSARVPSLGFGDYDKNLQMDFEAIYLNNTKGTLFPPIDTRIDSVQRKSSVVLNESFDNHYWFGWLSTVDYDINENFKFAGGLDFRTYQSEQYQEIKDLVGGDYYVPATFDLPETTNANAPYNAYREGDKYNYYNDNLMRWGAFFSELKYSKENWRGFINVSGVVTGYKRKDYFKNRDFVVDGTGERFQNAIGYGDVLFYNGTEILVAASRPDGSATGIQPTITQSGDTTFVNNPANTLNPYAPAGNSYIVGARRVDFDDDESKVSETPWKNIPGYTVKGGASYLVNEFNTVFVNVGYISRTPRFRNVVGFGAFNEFTRDIENENIASIELGYAYTSGRFAATVNSYYTFWKNRPTDNPVTVFLPDRGITVQANLNAMNAIHKGIEANVNYLISKKLSLEAFVSFGDWEWDSAKRVHFYDDEGNAIYHYNANRQPTDSLLTVDFDAKGVAVGDAPQTQIGGSLTYSFMKNAYVKARYTHFDRHYSRFDPLFLTNEDKGRQSWELPSFGLTSFYLGYRFDFDKVQLGFNFIVDNAFDVLYIADGQNNGGSSLVSVDYVNGQPEATQGFDANSASVYIGVPRTFSISAVLTL